MARRKDAPVSPELWAGIMLGLLALCSAGLLGIWFLGALSGKQLLGVLALVALAAFSVVLRYLTSAPPQD